MPARRIPWGLIGAGGAALAWWLMSDTGANASDAGSVPTIYGGPVSLATQIGRAIPFLRAARITRCQLHTSFEDTIEHGASYISRLHDAGVSEVWVACTGDEHSDGSMTAARLLDLRTRWAAACASAGARALVWDCEPAWKHNRTGFDAAAAQAMIRSARNVAPSLTQWLTSYFPPTWHSTFPWQAFLEVDGYIPQIYFPTGRKLWAWNLFRTSTDQAIHLGWIHPNARFGAYLQAHGMQPDETTWIANKFEFCSWWWIKDGADPNGRTAIDAMGQIEAQGFRGIGRIDAYQRSRGLPVTSMVDRPTCESLGLVWTGG